MAAGRRSAVLTEDLSLRASWTGDVACERPADKRVGVPVPHAMLRLQVAHDGHVLSRPQSATICCHSAIGRPYFFSMDGKYDAGPCFGHGGACSAILVCSFLPLTVIRRAGRADLIALAIDRCCGARFA